MKSSLIVICSILFLSLNSLAIRPTGNLSNFGGSKQLDIAKLEKTLGKKFSVPFPKKGYDIDFWNKGDLMPFKNAGNEILVACPMVSNDLIGMAVGTGTSSKDYKMTAELVFNFSNDGSFSSIIVMAYADLDFDPGHLGRPKKKEDESPQEFYERDKDFWLKRAGEGKHKVTPAQLEAAFKVFEATLEQRPKLKLKAPEKKKFPRIEEDY